MWFLDVLLLWHNRTQCAVRHTHKSSRMACSHAWYRRPRTRLHLWLYVHSVTVHIDPREPGGAAPLTLIYSLRFITPANEWGETAAPGASTSATLQQITSRATPANAPRYKQSQSFTSPARFNSRSLSFLFLGVTAGLSIWFRLSQKKLLEKKRRNQFILNIQ